MRGLICTLTGVATLAIASTAYAQSATPTGQHGDWTTYSYQEGGAKVCYALTPATDKQPPSLDHGDVFFIISQRPARNVVNEPQFAAGYNLSETSKVSAAIGERKFSMFAKGNRAWVENAAEEPMLVTAMKGGSSLKLAAKSGRGNATSYVFSLKGVSAALSAIASCK